MNPPLLYTAELDLAGPDVEPFLRWYAYRHAPDVFRAGFSTCACYRTDDPGMNLFDIYEIPSSSLFETPYYRGMRARDPYMGALMAQRRNKAHTVYEQQLIAPNAPGPSLDADSISVFRFALDTDETEALDDAIVAALSAHQPLLAASGLTRIRYAVRGQDHPTNPTFRPRCMVVAEWSGAAPADSGIPDVLHAAVGEAIADDSAFSGVRVYPWPDRSGA